MAKKNGRKKVFMKSSAGTGHFYTTYKGTGPENSEPLQLMKYDPIKKGHVRYDESKKGF